VTDQQQDIGVLTALAERLVNEMLPHALAMKERVDRGELLDDRDIHFLENVFANAYKVGPLVTRHPEYHDVAGRITQLYKEITDKALQNEQAKGSSGQSGQ
jgi:hypothetical protein